MGNFNRDRGDRPGGGRGFNDRSSRGPVEMHQAVCGKCGKDCEVPFRPTGERPVFCSNCFESNRNSDSRPGNFDDRQMFSAVCADCGKSCQVPFQPSNGKPVFCSSCFGDKKEGGNKHESTFQNREQSQPMPHKELFEQLNNKLDKILSLLDPSISAQVISEEVSEDVKEELPEEQVVVAKKTKVAKKKPSK